MTIHRLCQSNHFTMQTRNNFLVDSLLLCWIEWENGYFFESYDRIPAHFGLIHDVNSEIRVFLEGFCDMFLNRYRKGRSDFTLKTCVLRGEELLFLSYCHLPGI